MSPRMDNINNFSLSNNNENNYNNNAEINNNNDNNVIDDDDDDDNLSDIYIDDEPSPAKYNLILCELYNTRLHGDLHINTTNIYNYYLVLWKYKTRNMELINNDCESAHNNYLGMTNQTHSIFKNYQNIVRSEKYIQPEIAECIVLESGHCVAVKKTIWLRLIQRCWKNTFNKRKTIFKKRCSLTSILYREIHGHWPDNCRIMPSYRGILTF